MIFPVWRGGDNMDREYYDTIIVFIEDEDQTEEDVD